MKIKFIVILIPLLALSIIAKENNHTLRLGGHIGLYMPTGTFQHDFNPTPTFGIDGSFESGKKERIDITFGYINWLPGDNPDVEKLSFSMKYLHLGYTFFFNRKYNEYYVSPRIGLLFRNYSYKDENTDYKSDNMIYSFGVRPGYLYELNEDFLINASLNLDFALRNATESQAFSDEGEIMIYYGLSVGFLYGF